MSLTGFGLGALPWLWANAISGFSSLKPRNFPGNTITTSYSYRLDVFFSHVIPGQFGLTQPLNGLNVVAAVHGVVYVALWAITIAAIVVVVVMRRGRSLAIVA